MKRRFAALLCVLCLWCVLLSGCSVPRENNPLDGKDTDERVILCLEDNYPEHQFTTVRPFDGSRGIYADENGLECEAYSLEYDNTCHFGVTDSYFAGCLERAGFAEAADAVLREYGFALAEDSMAYDGSAATQAIPVDDGLDTRALAEAVKRVLNCVETPRLVMPDNTGFSTGQVSFHSIPEMGSFLVELECSGHTAFQSFAFSEKDSPVERIQRKLDAMTAYLNAEEEAADGTLLDWHDFLPEEGNAVKTEYGSFVLPEGWAEAGTEENGAVVYTENGQAAGDGVDQITVLHQTADYRAGSDQEARHRLEEQLERSWQKALREQPGAYYYTGGTGLSAYGDHGFAFVVTVIEADGTLLRSSYIMGDGEYCLVQQRNESRSWPSDDAAEQLLRTFRWKGWEESKG